MDITFELYFFDMVKFQIYSKSNSLKFCIIICHKVSILSNELYFFPYTVLIAGNGNMQGPRHMQKGRVVSIQ